MKNYKHIARVALLSMFLLAAWHGVEIYLCGGSQISLVDVMVAAIVSIWLSLRIEQKQPVAWFVVFSVIMLAVKFAWFGVETIICDYSMSSEIDYLFSALIAVCTTDWLMKERGI